MGVRARGCLGVLQVSLSLEILQSLSYERIVHMLSQIEAPSPHTALSVALGAQTHEAARYGRREMHVSRSPGGAVERVMWYDLVPGKACLLRYVCDPTSGIYHEGLTVCEVGSLHMVNHTPDGDLCSDLLM